MDKKATIYLETSVISYLTSRPSGNLVVAAHQHVTRKWWETERHKYQLLVSPSVVGEIQRGDPDAAAQRLEAINDIERLRMTEEAQTLATTFLSMGAIPLKAAEDAFHVAMCAVHDVDVLLTWNCKHIANIDVLDELDRACSAAGFEIPWVYTPFDILGGDCDD